MSITCFIITTYEANSLSIHLCDGGNYNGLEKDHLPPKIHVHQELQAVALFGNGVFEGIIKVRIEMRACWIQVALKSNDG